MSPNSSNFASFMILDRESKERISVLPRQDDEVTIQTYDANGDFAICFELRKTSIEEKNTHVPIWVTKNTDKRSVAIGFELEYLSRIEYLKKLVDSLKEENAGYIGSITIKSGTQPYTIEIDDNTAREYRKWLYDEYRRNDSRLLKAITDREREARGADERLIQEEEAFRSAQEAFRSAQEAFSSAEEALRSAQEAFRSAQERLTQANEALTRAEESKEKAVDVANQKRQEANAAIWERTKYWNNFCSTNVGTNGLFHPQLFPPDDQTRGEPKTTTKDDGQDQEH